MVSGPEQIINVKGAVVLSPREDTVVQLVAEGLSNRDIARELNLSEHTIKNYLFHIFDKVGISNRVELVLYAAAHKTCQEGDARLQRRPSARMPVEAADAQIFQAPTYFPATAIGPRNHRRIIRLPRA